MGGNVLHDIAQTFQFDAHHLANGASSVATEEELKSDRICLSRLTHLDLCGDILVILPQAGDLVTETDIPAKLLGPLFQQRLEANLRKVCRSERTRSDEVGIGIGTARRSGHRGSAPVAVMVAGNTGVPCRRSHALRRGTFLQNALGHPDFFKNLHRPLI